MLKQYYRDRKKEVKNNKTDNAHYKVYLYHNYCVLEENINNKFTLIEIGLKKDKEYFKDTYFSAGWDYVFQSVNSDEKYKVVVQKILFNDDQKLNREEIDITVEEAQYFKRKISVLIDTNETFNSWNSNEWLSNAIRIGFKNSTYEYAIPDKEYKKQYRSKLPW